jgi:hypothetical protein
MPYIIRPRRAQKIAAALFAAVLLIGVVPAMANAACPPGPTSHPFAPFGDNASYTLIPGGSFTSGAPGWSLTNALVLGASSESELRGASDNHGRGNEDNEGAGSEANEGGSHALVIYPYGVAVSPAFCVSSEYPSFRFFARKLEGFGSLNVSLRWTDSLGFSHEIPGASVQGGRSWAPSPVLELASKLPVSKPGSTLSVRLVFTPSLGSAWAIRDVYIDPYSR